MTPDRPSDDRTEPGADLPLAAALPLPLPLRLSSPWRLRAAWRPVAATEPQWIALFLIAQALLWFCWSLAFNAAPPGDNVEQLNWSRSLEFGYYKHPPLPTWLLHPFVVAGGARAWVTYGLGQACVGVALWLMWLGTARLIDRRTATVAILVGSCVHYFSARGHVYNHNTVMLVALGAAFWACAWLARAPARRHWLVLGLACGGGLLVKYQMALFVLTMAAGLVAGGVLRGGAARRGAAMATGVAMLTFSPHAIWLVANRFPTLDYAAASLGAALGLADRLQVGIGFAAQQLGRLAPALLVVALAVWLSRRAARAALGLLPSAVPGRGGDDALRERRLLIGLCVAPFVATVALAPAAGVRLQNHWGTGLALLLTPLLGLACLRLAPHVERRHVAAIACAIQLGLAVVTVLLPRSASTEAMHDYARYPRSQLVADARELWASVHGAGSPSLVIGPDWEAGLIAEALPVHAQVLIHATPAYAPWVPVDLADRCGALVVWNRLPEDRRALPWDLDARIVATREAVLLPEPALQRLPLRVGLAVIAARSDAPAGACPGDAAAGTSRSTR